MKRGLAYAILLNLFFQRGKKKGTTRRKGSRGVTTACLIPNTDGSNNKNKYKSKWHEIEVIVI
jgi:hypothetical protein